MGSNGFFCFSACMDGFQLVPGHCQSNGCNAWENENISDTNECGRLCLTTAGCRSYEYSKTELKCNLNRVDRPTAPVWEDYVFCAYSGDYPKASFANNNEGKAKSTFPQASMHTVDD